VIPRRHAAVADIAAGIEAEFAANLGIVRPLEPAAACIISFDQAPGGRHVQHPVDDQRRRFLGAVGVEIGKPRKAELLRVFVVDAHERAVALLAVGASVGKPITRFRIGICDPRTVNGFPIGDCEARGAAGCGERQQCQGKSEPTR